MADNNKGEALIQMLSECKDAAQEIKALLEFLGGAGASCSSPLLDEYIDGRLKAHSEMSIAVRGKLLRIAANTGNTAIIPLMV